ncbi:MAG: glycoside hydrolase family 9 protein [bacterium]|nr:glycoside hydrolase family 9 protein [bacterium]
MRFGLFYLLAFCWIFPVGSPAEPQIILNHIGYPPSASKECLLPGDTPTAFVICRAGTREIRFRGIMTPHQGDFGWYRIGRFDEFSENGTFILFAGEESSYPFTIHPTVYEQPMQTILRYFSIQRCGPSESGYNGPCHLDDGYRVENEKKTEKHIDVTHGWHDASDLRKWVSATIFGMIGIASAYEANPESFCQEDILDELQWGNHYFLGMQEPEGYIMNHCAGDVFQHGDQNRWSDSVFQNDDDRLIRTEPCLLNAQYNFIYTEAQMARLTHEVSPAYSQRCLETAEKCLQWCLNQETSQANDLGAAAAACVQLYKTTQDSKYTDLTVKFLDTMLALQVDEPIDTETPVRGFFRYHAQTNVPQQDIFRGCWHLLALCDAVETFPAHPNVKTWKQAISLYSQEYLQRLAARNGFGIVPFGLFVNKDPGGARQIGDYWYRYFMIPHPTWWVGINANLASAGVGLAKAARILGQPDLLALAQRQLDWIVGSNPFNASTVTDLGYNQPQAFINWNEFRPHTPLIPGAVMNGIGGTPEDMPALLPSHWQTTEYWTPMIGYTLWLMAELQ